VICGRATANAVSRIYAAGRRETAAAPGLLQGEPVIRDLQFDLLGRRRQLIGAKENDTADEDHDDNTDDAEKWLAHVWKINCLTMARHITAERFGK
jgi:hypothetical protein